MMTAINLMRTGTITATKKSYDRNKYNTEFKLKVLADVANRGTDSKASIARKYNINACVISYFEKEKGNDKTYSERLKHKKDEYLVLVSDGKVRRDVDVAKELGISQTTVGRWKKEVRA